MDLRAFERRHGEVLLRADLLGHRLIDIPRARLVRAYDLQLARTRAGWVLAGVHTHPASLWRRLLRRAAPTRYEHSQAADRGCRDWKAFEALIGHQPTVLIRHPAGRLRQLKSPADR